MKNPRYWKLLAFTIAVIAISSLLFGCTKQKLEPMTNIWYRLATSPAGYTMRQGNTCMLYMMMHIIQRMLRR